MEEADIEEQAQGCGEYQKAVLSDLAGIQQRAWRDSDVGVLDAEGDQAAIFEVKYSHTQNTMLKDCVAEGGWMIPR